MLGGRVCAVTRPTNFGEARLPEAPRCGDRPNRNTDYTEKYFVRCDVMEKFPFLVTKLSPCYDQ
jgi:hypothetical protein